MCKYLKFTFILPLFFIGCAEDEEESLPYIDVIWISYEKTASCYLPGVEDNWPDDYINIYGQLEDRCSLFVLFGYPPIVTKPLVLH